MNFKVNGLYKIANTAYLKKKNSPMLASLKTQILVGNTSTYSGPSMF